MKKKAIALFAAVISFCMIFASGCTESPSGKEPGDQPQGGQTDPAAPTGKEIDLYLIGGQSNAVGSSTHLNQLPGVYHNIGYAGCCDLNYNTLLPYGQSNVNSFDRFNWEVKAGYGGTVERVGPEYGMAQIFDGYYSGEKKAFIFKSAAGGTQLLNADNQAYEGNWYPRSMWDEGYDPGKTPSSMGFQYYWFVENFRNVYEELKANGYAPVVKGMAWMQGESNLPFYNQYRRLIRTFVDDIRQDLAQITGDEKLLEMPFVMGKIFPTFTVYNNPNAPKFNDMLETFAQSDENVYTIETEDLIIVNADGSINGTDQFHLNWRDMEQLGIRFGRKLSEINGLV